MQLGLDLYLHAFFDLDTERSHGDGLQRIPRSAIVDYAVHYDIVGEQREDLLFYVRKMDNAHLAVLAEKIKPNDDTKGIS